MHLTQVWEQKLDSVHMKCLRRVLKIRPTHVAKRLGTEPVTNQQVARIAGAKPLSCHVARARVRLLGHALRRGGADPMRAVCYDRFGNPKHLGGGKMGRGPEENVANRGGERGRGGHTNDGMHGASAVTKQLAPSQSDITYGEQSIVYIRLLSVGKACGMSCSAAAFTRRKLFLHDKCSRFDHALLAVLICWLFAQG